MFDDAPVRMIERGRAIAPHPERVTVALDALSVNTVILFDSVSHEPNASSYDRHLDILDEFLSRKFRQVATYPDYRVLRREQP